MHMLSPGAEEFARLVFTPEGIIPGLGMVAGKRPVHEALDSAHISLAEVAGLYLALRSSVESAQTFGVTDRLRASLGEQHDGHSLLSYINTAMLCGAVEWWLQQTRTRAYADDFTPIQGMNNADEVLFQEVQTYMAGRLDIAPAVPVVVTSVGLRIGLEAAVRDGINRGDMFDPSGASKFWDAVLDPTLQPRLGLNESRVIHILDDVLSMDRTQVFHDSLYNS